MKALVSFKQVLSIAVLTVVFPLAALSQNGTTVEQQKMIAKAIEGIKAKALIFNAPTLNGVEQSKFKIENPEVKVPSVQKKSLRGGTGVDGGGGNAVANEPITEKDILELVQWMKTYSAMKLILNFASAHKDRPMFDENNTDYQQDDRQIKNFKQLVSLNNKLFYSSVGSIYDIIDYGVVRINIQEKACFDPYTNEETDASANLKDFSICLSSSRLIKSMNKADYGKKLTILLLHEYVHLLGATEDEAMAMEEQLNSRILQPPQITLLLSSSDVFYQSKIVTDTINELSNNFDKMNDADICLSVFKLYQADAAGASGSSLNSQAMDIWDINERAQYADILSLRIFNLLQSCRNTSAKDILRLIENDRYEKDFFAQVTGLFKNNENQLQLNAAIKRLEDSSFDMSVKLTGSILNVSTGDRQNIKAEVRELKLYAEYLKKKLTDYYGMLLF